MKGSDERALIERFKQKDKRALARILSIIEKKDIFSSELFEFIWKNIKGRKKLGITGLPGSGKSTLINCLISAFRKQGKSVACLLIDPSSPFSGGAVLGDRIRMQKHFTDPEVFIRSLASRGELGGICSTAVEMIFALDAFGADEIIIETVGVGQSEIEIAGVAETVVVVITPEAGDAIQTLKAGLFEVGDIFVINKADRPGARALFEELKSAFAQERFERKVLLCSAQSGEGIDELVCAIGEQREAINNSIEERKSQLRKRYFIQLINLRQQRRLEETIKKDFAHLLERVGSGELTPKQALLELEKALPF